MKKLNLPFAALLLLLVSMSSCELVGGIFKAGFNTAIILGIIVFIIIIWVVVRMRRR
jgi:uncharacterized membrane protein